MKELMTNNISPIRWQTVNIQTEKKKKKKNTSMELIQDKHKENHT